MSHATGIPCGGTWDIIRRDRQNHEELLVVTNEHGFGNTMRDLTARVARLEKALALAATQFGAINQHAYDDDTPTEDLCADFDAMRTIAKQGEDSARAALAEGGSK